MAHYKDFWNLYVHIPKGQNMKRDRALGGGQICRLGGSKRAGGTCPTQPILLKEALLGLILYPAATMGNKGDKNEANHWVYN